MRRLRVWQDSSRASRACAESIASMQAPTACLRDTSEKEAEGRRMEQDLFRERDARGQLGSELLAAARAAKIPPPAHCLGLCVRARPRTLPRENRLFAYRPPVSRSISRAAPDAERANQPCQQYSQQMSFGRAAQASMRHPNEHCVALALAELHSPRNFV